jgi:hypothetical protein
VAAYVAAARALRWWKGRSVLPTRELTGGEIMGIFWVLLVYGVVRNFPFAPFAVLAP